jgi:uncharacterized protein YdeI (YjbR/CyaY-like superfamily)
MGTRDPRVDAYIEQAPAFAQIVLRHLRGLVHDACPEVAETIRWRMPSFQYRGILCSMAAFKQHCTFGFWHPLMREEAGRSASSTEAMGQFGRITSVADLPKDGTLKALIRRAAKLNASGVKVPRPADKKRPLVVPKDLGAALRENDKARVTFKSFSRSRQREYVDWIESAKRDDTRARRLATAIEWLAAGKVKEWRYQKR